MRKILIPTDFSENALNAIRFATELFKYERSEFFIIHTYADEIYNHDTLASRAILEELKTIAKKNTEKELHQLLGEIHHSSPNPKHTYHTKALFGHLVDEANDLVNQENIDIIFMGTRGKTDDRKLTFGSNTLQVLKYVKCPVLAIPSVCEYQKPKEILFPTDYFLPLKRRELKLLSTLARSFRSRITLFHVSKYEHLSFRQEDNKAFLTQCLQESALQFKTVASGGLTLAINEYIQNQPVDLLVMVNSRHSYLESILYQSTIDKIGLHIKTPFLILQNLNR